MIEMRVEESMGGIPPAAWDSLAGDEAPPFLKHAFLDALERAGCVKPERGWLPMHLTFWEDGELVAAAPAYVKGNSEGEFVFDYGWADFAERLGLRYYPKLLLAVPFTPATGPRLLVRQGADEERLLSAAAEGVRRLVDANRISGAHVLFLPPGQAEHFDRGGFVQRWGVQYQWHNRGYGSFEEFLSTFPSKRRTQIRRERREMRDRNIKIETRRGDDITSE